MHIDVALTAPVAAWAASSFQRFQKNGPGRQFAILQRKDLTPPQEVWEIKRQVVECFGLHNAQQEPVYQDFCGYIVDGGAVHRHQDANVGQKIHTRFNVLVGAPESGGVPVIAEKEIDVIEGGVWVCAAGLHEHWCTPVVGSKPRIILSFGFLI